MMSEEQFIAAYDEYADAIFRFCYAQCGNRDLAHDLTQEAFARAWRYVAGGKRIDQMRPFLYRTARNALIDHLRRASSTSLDRMREQGFDIADERTVGPVEAAQTAEAVRLIGELEPKYREAVSMRYIDELSPRDIAAAVGTSENTVSVRIHRGLQKLRELMGIKNG
jgi:RNA polymerase sigma-70 factor, ECF subfamily